jgi:hypothetical protein
MVSGDPDLEMGFFGYLLGACVPMWHGGCGSGAARRGCRLPWRSFLEEWEWEDFTGFCGVWGTKAGRDGDSRRDRFPLSGMG